jgi:hypothetical protein
MKPAGMADAQTGREAGSADEGRGRGRSSASSDDALFRFAPGGRGSLSGPADRPKWAMQILAVNRLAYPGYA